MRPVTCEAIPREVQTPSAILAGMNDLERHRRAAAAELERVVAERAALAKAVVGGDRLATARCAWLNARTAELLIEVDGAIARKDAAAEQLGDLLEARQRGRAAQPVQRGDKAATARALLAQSRRVDELMAELKAALVQRDVLARRLLGMGTVCRQVLNPARVRAAAAHHGLLDQLAAAPCPERLFAPLADADEVALRDLFRPRPSAAKERVA
ncbi:hypothetical protein [Paracraurococcus lichenis]|uniref:Uncharacterized protein n=1 Tax=Paracraurococcus lichenis TaxID=3064888 RepID=A0ABT9EC28_9PROT|nr:hypothetical protein [Paracraurococcus sp. LOR1-02]MDO9713766.1 hypothetical protein [Paracraurococcus sp. LOR1-02]